jgi:hypothetical protein
MTPGGKTISKGVDEMETIPGRNSCKCEGQEYAHQEKVCQETSCFICKDGKWEMDNKVSVL